ncbi:hypothetical protein C8R45DRAFT_997751 [Mycena sanguinolenta]|nr:hypothetical protein C8R45DRAFT_997751 [Mycena sanguinolenta]
MRTLATLTLARLQSLLASKRRASPCPSSGWSERAPVSARPTPRHSSSRSREPRPILPCARRSSSVNNDRLASTFPASMSRRATIPRRQRHSVTSISRLVCFPSFALRLTSFQNGTDTIGHLVFNPETSTLNASNSNMTTLSMVPSGTASSNGKQSVALQLPMSSNSTSPYCATFDPNPPAPAPLTVEACNSTNTTHTSQTFSYDPLTGRVSPMWGSNDDGPSSGTLNSRDAPESVTLVFVPDSPATAANEASDQAQSASMETVTTTVTATPSSSVAAVSSMTDASTSDASTPSPSLAAAEFDPASSTTYSLSQPTSSSSATDSSVAPASSSAVPTFGALAVEVAPAPSSDPVVASSSVPSVSSSGSSASSSSLAPSATVSAVDAASDSSSALWSSEPTPSSTFSADGDSFFSDSASATTDPSSSASAAGSDPTVVPATNEDQSQVFVDNASGRAAQW